jgi:uncharacterized protein
MAPPMADEDRTRAPGEKTRRPRDELGRLLPWGTPNRLVMEDFDSLTLEENHALARRHFNGKRFFPAHEAWETAWKQARGTDDEEFFKGLSQLGAGYVHFRRGNPHGAHTLIRRAISRIERYGAEHHGVTLEPLLDGLREHAGLFEAAEREQGPMPEVEPPTV